MPPKTPLELGKRERQIIETVQRLGEGSVAEILRRAGRSAQLLGRADDARAAGRQGLAQDSPRRQTVPYRPAISRECSQRTALRRLLGTLFGGSTNDAVAALLDISASEMTDDQWDRLAKLVDKARKENRSS